MEYLKRFWNWLVKSSVNPAELSMTVQGFLLGILPLLLAIAPMFGLKLDSQSLGDVVGALKQVIELGLGSVAAIFTLYGFIRKVVVTIKG